MIAKSSFFLGRIVLVFAMFPAVAHAYIGPGLGLGVIGSVIGVFFCFFLAGIAVVWHPIKKLIQRMRKTESGKTGAMDPGETSDPGSTADPRQ